MQNYSGASLSTAPRARAAPRLAAAMAVVASALLVAVAIVGYSSQTGQLRAVSLAAAGNEYLVSSLPPRLLSSPQCGPTLHRACCAGVQMNQGRGRHHPPRRTAAPGFGDRCSEGVGGLVGGGKAHISSSSASSGSPSAHALVFGIASRQCTRPGPRTGACSAGLVATRACFPRQAAPAGRPDLFTRFGATRVSGERAPAYPTSRDEFLHVFPELRIGCRPLAPFVERGEIAKLSV